MEKIKEYIFSLMIVSISCAAVNMLAPDTKRISKYVHFLAALVISLVMLLPVHSLIDELPKLFEGEYIPNAKFSLSDSVNAQELIISETVEIMEKEIKTMVAKRLNTEPKAVTVEYDARDIENIIITRVTIEYEKANGYLISDTKSYIKQELGCECEVISGGA